MVIIAWIKKKLFTQGEKKDAQLMLVLSEKRYAIKVDKVLRISC